MILAVDVLSLRPEDGYSNVEGHQDDGHASCLDDGLATHRILSVPILEEEGVNQGQVSLTEPQFKAEDSP